MENARSLACSLALLLAACGDEGGAPLTIPDGCNPLASEHHCLLPYPSDFFLRGGTVTLTPAATTKNEDGAPVDVLALHPADGFSPGQQILALFPQGIDEEPLVGAADDLALSLGDESPTVLLDVERGERVLHLAELDPRADDDARRALAIRPLVRLRDGARYVVAIRGLSDPSGALLPAPAGFARLRDGGDTSHPALAPLALRYESDVFGPLAAAGIARADLQLAWDFTVRTRESTTSDMLAVREQVMAALAADPTRIEVLGVEDQPEEHQYRRIEARIEVPLFLQSTELGAMLHRGADGAVAPNGSVEVPFTILVPDSVANRPPGAPPARLLQFGHGFFGGRDEIHGFIDELADERGFVVIAADWWGMSSPDRELLIGDLLGNTAESLRFTDRVHQAMANFIALSYAAGSLADLPELAIGEVPIVDASKVYFYGISQGHILGGTYFALAPRVERAVLGVGGANLSLMMFRARPFLPFLALIDATIPDPLDQQIVTAMMQMSFDRIDPLSYAPFVFDEPLAGGPSDKRVLLQIGIGDAAVPNLGSHLHGRALGLPLLDPAPRAIAGLEGARGPLSSALVEFDFGIDPLPGLQALPAEGDNEVHEGVRRLEAAKEQLDRFLSPAGQIEHTCDGPCDPE